MKNKNQNALDNIGSTYFSMNYVANEKLRLEFEKMYNEYKQTLQELVDRATPKKPNYENINYICCPSCGLDEIELYDYYGNEINLKQCNNCGQALDWSNNE